MGDIIVNGECVNDPAHVKIPPMPFCVMLDVHGHCAQCAIKTINKNGYCYQVSHECLTWD